MSARAIEVRAGRAREQSFTPSLRSRTNNYRLYRDEGKQLNFRDNNNQNNRDNSFANFRDKELMPAYVAVVPISA